MISAATLCLSSSPRHPNESETATARLRFCSVSNLRIRIASSILGRRLTGRRPNLVPNLQSLRRKPAPHLPNAFTEKIQDFRDRPRDPGFTRKSSNRNVAAEVFRNSSRNVTVGILSPPDSTRAQTSERSRIEQVLNQDWLKLSPNCPRTTQKQPKKAKRKRTHINANAFKNQAFTDFVGVRDSQVSD